MPEKAEYIFNLLNRVYNYKSIQQRRYRETGVAYEIHHEYNNKYGKLIPQLIEYFKTHSGNKNVLNKINKISYFQNNRNMYGTKNNAFNNQVYSILYFFIENIELTDIERTNYKKKLNEVIKKACFYDDEKNNEKSLILSILKYIKFKNNKELTKYYVTSLLDESVFAYGVYNDKSPNFSVRVAGISCVPGIRERFLTILTNYILAMCNSNYECEFSELYNIINIEKRQKYNQEVFTELSKEFYFLEGNNYENMSINDKKEYFKFYILMGFIERNYQPEYFIEEINEELNQYFIKVTEKGKKNELFSGGKRKK